jgi:DNA-binding NarL/FixJ family response regulator
MEKLRVALVDDHALFREGLSELLARQSDLAVVAEAGDARQAYQVVEASRPDVVVLDVALPGTDGIAAAREILRRTPGSKVLMLTMFADQDYAARALAAGALGYALKMQDSGTVLDAIRAVGRGESYLPPGMGAAGSRAQQRGHHDGPLGRLSEREREVFGLVVRGLSNGQVAGELCISVKTVETHRARIHRKLGVHSVAELVRFAALRGLITH